MSKFEESNFYKALQDFFINADKKTFLEFLAEFYNRTEGIINKNNIQDDLIKELRELYLEFNEKGIDENIVREKVNYFLENSTKIKNIYSQLDTKANLNSIFTMANMGQDIKEAMSGGSVAVVGENAILTENIVNNQVVPVKTSFFDIDENGNLLDRNGLIKGYYYNNSGEKINDNNAYSTDLIKFDKNLDYKINFLSYVTFWDINKNFISGYIEGSANPDAPSSLLNKPENGKYVRFSVWKESKNNCVFCKSSNYNKEIKTNYFLKETTIKENILDENLKTKLNNITSSSSDKYFQDKKVSFLGDSITYGVDGSTNGEVVAKPYPTLVSEILKCRTINLGIPGSTIAGDGITDSDITNNKIGFLPMNERYTQIDSDSDYIIVFGGINDYTANVKTPLGTKGDNTNLTFYGALKILLDGLIERYPNAKIGYITPLKKSGWYNNNEFGVNLEKYYKAIIELCEERSIPVLDFFKNGGCYGEVQAWKNVNLPDGLHPTQVYYNKLSRPISEFIKSI